MAGRRETSSYNHRLLLWKKTAWKISLQLLEGHKSEKRSRDKAEWYKVSASLKRHLLRREGLLGLNKCACVVTAKYDGMADTESQGYTENPNLEKRCVCVIKYLNIYIYHC